MLFKKIVLFTLSFCFLLSLSAQEQVDSSYVDDGYQVDRFLVDIGLARMYPQGDLNANYDPRWAIDVGFYTRISNRFPLFVGIDAAFTRFDRYSENYFLIDADGFEFEVEERTRASLLNVHGVLRAQPYFNFFLHPYAELFLGGKHFYTRTVLEDLDAPDDNTIIENVGQNGAWALSVGGSIGVNIPLSSFNNGGIELDLKCVYLKGNTATYTSLKEEIDFTNYIDTFDAFELKTSSTNIFMPQLGLMIYFGG